MDKKKVVEIKGLVKNYGTRGFQTRVLKGIDLTIYQRLINRHKEQFYWMVKMLQS